MTTLRERQAPLKAQYEADPESAKLVMTVRSATSGDDPTRCTVATVGAPGGNGVAWEAGAHPMAGGEGDLACSGDLLLASLAACQEITLRMVAAAMGIELRNVEVNIEGDLDFRGTMGIDPETPVGFQQHPHLGEIRRGRHSRSLAAAGRAGRALLCRRRHAAGGHRPYRPTSRPGCGRRHEQ